ncbi:MAG TPA: hypothetical protein VJ927_02240 [Actinomycetota bacterium]|nr:hypothetical protein [Actinomycetota bacterium]
MTGFVMVLEYLDLAAFVLLGVLSYRHWRQRRDQASMWAFLMFGTLALIGLLGEVLPEEGDGTFLTIVEKVVIAILLLFPYFLYRLAASFRSGVRSTWDAAAVLMTGAVILWGFLIPRLPDQGEERSAVVQLFVMAVLVQWVTLSVVVAARLWRAGSDQPVVASRRMRSLGAASILLSVVIVISGTASDERSVPVELMVQALILSSLGGFYLALFPPAWLRTLWRGASEARLRDAVGALMTASTREEVVEGVLPHAAELVGGHGVALVDKDSNLLGSTGFAPEELTDPGSLGARSKDNDRLAVLEYPFGCLAIKTTPHTPFFGQDDIDLLGSLGLLTNLALQRLDKVELEREVAELHARRRQALEINDNVVQGLAVAHYSFELGQEEKGRQAVADALAAARRIIGDLVKDLPAHEQFDPATLTREAPAFEQRRRKG